MLWTDRNKTVRLFMAAALTLLLFHISAPPARCASVERNEVSAVKDGWGWPVVVVPPVSGWESEEGSTIKLAMRAAEREVSVLREGIRGREVIFMFANLGSEAEIPDRLPLWRRMNVSVIVSFGGPQSDEILGRLCAKDGPSVIFCGGEDLRLIDPEAGTPYAYLFALDLPYKARAGALAALAAKERPLPTVAVFSDVLSEKLAAGARLNEDLLKARGMKTMPIWVSAMRGGQFAAEVGEAESGGAGVITSWLDGMATLSIWRSANINRKGTRVYHAGLRHRMLLDAEGLTLVDKDVLLERNERGKHDIILKVRDLFGKAPSDPVLAAKAYALASWVIAAYTDENDTNTARIARALEIARDIPLMDETLFIDRRTHRPAIRRFGVLTVEARQYRSAGAVEVYSSEVNE